MNKKALKTIRIIVIVIVFLTLMISTIVSQDEHHLEICHEEHCKICMIIHIAKDIVGLLVALFINIIVGFLINFYLTRIQKIQIIFMKESLVFQKVQLNE